MQLDKVDSVEISASILAADPLNLTTAIHTVQSAGVDRLHVDIMDGHYVPNITFGPHIINALKGQTTLPFEVHLMVEKCDAFIPMFAASADTLIIHPESTQHLHKSLQLIKDHQVKTGFALNPGTPVEFLTPVIDMLDYVLVMSVNPGFGGQDFIPSSYTKVQQVRTLIDRQKHPIDLAVDGGVTPSVSGKLIECGANILVAGSAIFKHPNHLRAIQELKLASKSPS
ncbi:MAG: ribulose-phosphate 3-epimerase [Alphaproteobacteria bacterium]|nr:ribulose-phosphate 3-epimerase [Alphaproteobacteria bacterium]